MYTVYNHCPIKIGIVHSLASDFTFTASYETLLRFGKFLIFHYLNYTNLLSVHTSTTYVDYRSEILTNYLHTFRIYIPLINYKTL